MIAEYIPGLSIFTHFLSHRYVKVLLYFIFLISPIYSEPLYEFSKLSEYYENIMESYSKYKYPPILYEPPPFQYKLMNYKSYVLFETKQDIYTKCKENPSLPCNQIAQQEIDKEEIIRISRIKDRKFCIQSEELAYLDFLAWLKENENPYALCKEERSDDEIQKHLSKLRKEIFGLLLPVKFPYDLHSILSEFPKHSADKKLKDRIDSIESQRQELLISMGNFHVYTDFFTKLENKEYTHPDSGKEFVLIRDIYDFLIQTNRSLFYNRRFLLVGQMKWNSESNEKIIKSNKLLKRDIDNQSKIIINLLNKKELKASLLKARDCLKSIDQKEARINLGFYSGFFHKYSIQYEPDAIKSKEDEIYQKISQKLQLNYQKYTIQSELFEERLQFIEKNCKEVVKKLDK